MPGLPAGICAGLGIDKLSNGDNTMNKSEDRVAAIRLAAEWLTRNPVFLDTETTGLGEDAQVCDLAVVGVHGNVLMNTLIRPTVLIPEVVSAVHHITNDMVADAPTFAEVMPVLTATLAGHCVVTYNASYDLAMIRQSARANGRSWATEQMMTWQCAMRMYAMFRGIVNPRYRTYKWHRLNEAASHCGIPLPLDLHRALADAELARHVVLHVASIELPTRIE